VDVAAPQKPAGIRELTPRSVLVALVVASRYAVPIASGLIVGDALVAVILPILHVAGIMTPV